MPIYELENEAGERREEFFHVTSAPRLGAWVEIDGQAWQRVIEAPQIPSSKGQENYRLHSNACPNLARIEGEERRARYLQEKGHADVRMPVRAPAYDEHGRAVFKSPKELHDYCARDGRYAVGNPKEICQAQRAAVIAKKNKTKAEVAQREKLCKTPQVN